MTTLHAYLAGAIDADGYITIQRSVRRAGPNHKHAPTYYVAKIGLGETDRIIPDLLKEAFGGSVSEYQPTRSATHKRVYLWSTTNKLAANAIAALRPYLRLKRAQADIALTFIKQAARHNGRTMPGRLPAHIIAEREAAWLDMTRLNAPRNRRVHLPPPGY